MISKLIKKLKSNVKHFFLKNMSPDSHILFLKKEYEKRTGEKLDIKNPKKYTEKIQYSKIHLNTSLKTQLSDKYLVRDWVTDKIGSQYLIPLLGVWDSFSEINFEELPNRFVLKTNSGSGTNLIVKNKRQLDYREAQKKFDKWMTTNFAYYGDIQLHYKDIETKIVAEKFIENKDNNLPEYKFLCFNGKVYYCWFIITESGKEYRNVYDLDWNIQPWSINNIYEKYPAPIPKPQNFDKMIEISRILSQDFFHVRVDLYDVEGKIYFGEMTFTSGGGYSLIYPEKYNYLLGDLWDIESKN